jgi:hypothetical protein
MELVERQGAYYQAPKLASLQRLTEFFFYFAEKVLIWKHANKMFGSKYQSLVLWLIDRPVAKR